MAISTKRPLASMHHSSGTKLDGFSSWNSAAVDVSLVLRLHCTTCGLHVGQDTVYAQTVGEVMGAGMNGGMIGVPD